MSVNPNKLKVTKYKCPICRKPLKRNRYLLTCDNCQVVWDDLRYLYYTPKTYSAFTKIMLYNSK